MTCVLGTVKPWMNLKKPGRFVVVVVVYRAQLGCRVVGGGGWRMGQRAHSPSWQGRVRTPGLGWRRGRERGESVNKVESVGADE